VWPKINVDEGEEARDSRVFKNIHTVES